MGNLCNNICFVWSKHWFIIPKIWMVHNLDSLKNHKWTIMSKNMDCGRCGKPAVYSRKYSGENFCSSCFSDAILRKTARTISKYNMIKQFFIRIKLVLNSKISTKILDYSKGFFQEEGNWFCSKRYWNKRGCDCS